MPAPVTAESVEATLQPQFDSDKIVGILYESFRHSQGSVGLQQQLLTFIGERHAGQLHGFSEDSEDESLIDSVHAGLTAAATRYVSRGTAHRRIDQDYVDQNPNKKMKDPQEFINDQVVNTMIMLKEGVDHNPNLPKFNAGKALIDIVTLDAKYLAPPPAGNGRPRPGAQRDPHRQGQAVETSHHASQLMLYGLIGQPTRLSEIDEFYHEAAAALPDYLDYLQSAETEAEYEADQQLCTVVEQHLRHYPADATRIQPQYRDLLIRHWGEAEARAIGLPA